MMRGLLVEDYDWHRGFVKSVSTLNGTVLLSKVKENRAPHKFNLKGDGDAGLKLST